MLPPCRVASQLLGWDVQCASGDHQDVRASCFVPAQPPDKTPEARLLLPDVDHGPLQGGSRDGTKAAHGEDGLVAAISDVLRASAKEISKMPSKQGRT
jgi:hypothetical protein